MGEGPFALLAFTVKLNSSNLDETNFGKQIVTHLELVYFSIDPLQLMRSFGKVKAVFQPSVTKHHPCLNILDFPIHQKIKQAALNLNLT